MEPEIKQFGQLINIAKDMSVVGNGESNNFEMSVDWMLSGDNLNPDDITRELGIDPLHKHLRGQRIGSKFVYPTSLWSYGLQTTIDSPDVLIEALLSKINNEMLIRKWNDMYDGRLYVGIHHELPMAGVHINRKNIERIASLHFNLEIAFHLFLSEKQKEELARIGVPHDEGNGGE